MIWVKAVYRLPAIRHLLFVVPFPDRKESYFPSLKRIQKKAELEELLLSKDQALPKKSLKWTIKLVQEDDFLSSLESQRKKLLQETNLSSDIPQDLELLAINLLPTHSSSYESLSSVTPKILSQIPDEDIIEVSV